MLDTLARRLAVRLVPRLVPPTALHHDALVAASRGDHRAAEQLFESAALGYRRSLAVEPLARLRVHQAMNRVRAAGPVAADGEGLLEVVRGVSRLDTLERTAWPHEPADARTVLAEWLGEPARPGRAA